MFTYYLIKPEDRQLKESYHKGLETQQALNSVPIDKLKEMGYNDEQIKSIIEDYKRML